MRARLLAADLKELARAGATVDEAFSRGSAALGVRPIRMRPTEAPGTRAAVDELVHIYAEAYAQMRLLHFSFSTRAGDYRRSKGRYHSVEDALFDARRHVIPALRARLRDVRAREELLVRELEEQGVPADTIGPTVPPDRAQETDLMPGEGPPERRTLPPLPSRPTLLERLRRRR
jgi:hypothetical protein